MVREASAAIVKPTETPLDSSCQCETQKKDVSTEQYSELATNCWFGEDPEACADLEVLTDEHGHFESHMDASGRAWLDLLSIEDADGTDKLFFNPTYTPILWNPAAHAIMWGRAIDSSIGKAVTGGKSDSAIASYITKISEDPLAAAPLISVPNTGSPLPGLAVYGISKLF
jgi:hypothetical protein